MARPKTDRRNELKTRVRDATYEAVQQYKSENRCSEEQAISDLLELALFGVVGTVPVLLVDSRRELAQFGTKTQA